MDDAIFPLQRAMRRRDRASGGARKRTRKISTRCPPPTGGSNLFAFRIFAVIMGSAASSESHVVRKRAARRPGCGKARCGFKAIDRIDPPAKTCANNHQRQDESCAVPG